MIRDIRNIVVGLMVVGISLHGLYAQTISVDPGAWRVNLSGEITEAGDDFIGTYESAADQITISVSDVSTSLWSVSVRYQSQPTWDPTVLLDARRTGTGTAIFLLGGTTYQTVTTTDTELFTGFGDVDDIPIQYRLSNVSVTIPAITSAPYYRMRVLYTLTAF